MPPAPFAASSKMARKLDRKSTRLNSSHLVVSYAVFCLKNEKVELGGQASADNAKDPREYLAAAFPDLNAYKRASGDAYYACMVDSGIDNQRKLTKLLLY